MRSFAATLRKAGLAIVDLEAGLSGDEVISLRNATVDEFRRLYDEGYDEGYGDGYADAVGYADAELNLR